MYLLVSILGIKGSHEMTTIYVVHLAVILIWQFDDFGFDH